MPALVGITSIIIEMLNILPAMTEAVISPKLMSKFSFHTILNVEASFSYIIHYAGDVLELFRVSVPGPISRFHRGT